MTSDLALMGFREMVAGDLSGGSVTYGSAEYPATIGTFQQEQDLTAGGFSPSTIAMLTVAREDLEDGTEFQTGKEILVSPKIGPERACQVRTIRDMGPLIEIEVRDENQGA